MPFIGSPHSVLCSFAILPLLIATAQDAPKGPGSGSPPAPSSPAPTTPKTPATPSAPAPKTPAPSAPAAPPGGGASGATESGTPQPGSAGAIARMKARRENRSAWQLGVTPGPMRIFVDPADGKPYWYFTYKAVNTSGRDLRFAPKLELVDDEGRIEVSGHNVPSEVVRKVMALLGNPLLQDQNQILGDILQGEENAKDGVVVFSVSKLASKELTLYISGISSERQKSTGMDGKPVILRNQFRVAYQVPGDALSRGSEPLPLVDDSREPNPRWILR